jgi:phosphoribosylaminoimidazolecarboxamide formyltransferase / IMP cyclohydrolase
MEAQKKIKSALISVYYKDGLDVIVKTLNNIGVKIYSTGGTQEYISSLGISVTSVESLTSYPSILGGRVKTLHPKVFGGILGRRENENDMKQMQQYEIPEIDLVIVDLYPFEETLAKGAADKEIIEKIDIGGISLIRAAAKNFEDVLIVPSSLYYEKFIDLLNSKNGLTGITDRKTFAGYAFNVSSHYDTAIFNYFNKEQQNKAFKHSIVEYNVMRYGENPHQEGVFYGKIEDVLEQLHGKQLSYNNLLDIDAAINLINEFTEPTFAIIKHNNACGIACRKNLTDAWKDALAGDPVSAFGGVLITNTSIDEITAKEINKLFFEIIIAPAYENISLEILEIKKNRIILQLKPFDFTDKQFKSVLNGVLEQTRDNKTETENDLRIVTKTIPTEKEKKDMLFANKIVKHTKSNAIVLAKNGQLLASGMGQTSRIDSLKQAIKKAKDFGFDLNGAVMASDAFFPFPDCVILAEAEGIRAVIQPGGSINDKESIAFCDHHEVAMAITGFRHFKH